MENAKRKPKATQKPNRLIVSRTLALMIVCGVVAFLVLIGKLYEIQIIEHDNYQNMAVEQQVRETTIRASRGTIYDANMKIMAMSATVDTIFISPVEMLTYNEDASLIALELSQILGVSYESIMKMWENTDSWYQTVARKIEPEISQQVRELKNKYELKSVHIVEDTKRYYPYSSLASQIIGFVGTDNNGLEGIEAICEARLRGVNGRIVRATNSNGTDMLYTRYENYYDAVSGNSIVLTVDSTIQYYLDKHLEQAIKDYDIANGAMGIVMNVETGAVLAMTALPDYDLNNFAELNEDAAAALEERKFEGGLLTEEGFNALDEGSRATLEFRRQDEGLLVTTDDFDSAYRDALQGQWRNRVVTDTYDPGSTFKIITLAAALEEGAVSETDNFYCSGAIDVIGREPDDPVHCWHRPGHGSQDLQLAAQHSCNVAFVRIAQMLGADKFYNYIEAFGFKKPTGIEFKGEPGGLWWSREAFTNPNDQSSLAAASFGQTFKISPLQLITAVSAVANGGYLMEPYIVSQVLDPGGNIIETRAPKVVRQVISEETSRKVCAILESVVGGSEGTGKNAYVSGYRIAGKTGTSEYTGSENRDDCYIVSFIGFAPADDPKIAVLVLLDSPKVTDIYISGGVMAAPVVGHIFADVLPYAGIEPAYSESENSKKDVSLPNVRNYSVGEARDILSEAGLDARIVGDGDIVTDQIPISNVTIARGSTVVLYTEGERETSKTEVPNLFGMSYSDAKYTLSQSGLYIRSNGVAPSDSYTIVVARQSVEPGAEVTNGTVIEVTIIDSDSSLMENGSA